jgi:predicted nucleic acid-binding protein
MVRTKKAQKVVCDSGPLIHLDELNSLHLLRDFKEILISHTVSKEVTRYRPAALRKLTKSYVLSPGNVPVDRQLLILCQMFSLDAGEIEALALMEKNRWLFF